MRAAIPPHHHTSSWGGAYLSTGTLLFPFYWLISQAAIRLVLRLFKDAVSTACVL